MGLIVPNFQTEHGLTIPNAYIGISKSFNGLALNETAEKKIHISAYYMVFASKENREEDKKHLMCQYMDTTVEKDKLGNVFDHLYEVLKQKFPDAVDDI